MLTLGEEFDLDKSGVMALFCGILVLRNYVEVFKRRFLLTNSRALMPSRGVNNKSKLSISCGFHHLQRGSVFYPDC